MQPEKSAPTRSVNIDDCLYCVHYQALGCSGSTRFCTYLNVFLLHQPAGEQCSHRQGVEGSD